MKRRAFLLTALALASTGSRAQSSGRKVRVGILTTAGKRGETPFYLAMERRFRELGYRDGENLILDWHSATGQIDKIPEIAALLARNKCDVVISPGSELVLRSIRSAVGQTPIVMIAVDFDPVARNFIASLAKPGGNITGLVLRQLESAAKRLELLSEVMPGATRIAVLWDQFSRDQLAAVEDTAKALKLTLLSFEMRGNDYEFGAPIRAARAQKANALFVLSSGRFFPQRSQMFDAANAQRLPVITNHNYADDGALIAFGASFSHAYRRAAEYVDRILKGSRPAEMPVEQPDRYELILNLKVAKAFGIKIPQPVLVRADRIVE